MDPYSAFDSGDNFVHDDEQGLYNFQCWLAAANAFNMGIYAEPDSIFDERFDAASSGELQVSMTQEWPAALTAMQAPANHGAVDPCEWPSDEMSYNMWYCGSFIDPRLASPTYADSANSSETQSRQNSCGSNFSQSPDSSIVWTPEAPSQHHASSTTHLDAFASDCNTANPYTQFDTGATSIHQTSPVFDSAPGCFFLPQKEPLNTTPMAATERYPQGELSSHTKHIVPEVVKGIKVYVATCPLCSFKYKSATRKYASSNLSRHFLWDHNPTTPKPHCYKCRRDFSRPDNLKQHNNRKHLYACQVPGCGMRFSSPDALNRHMASKHRPNA